MENNTNGSVNTSQSNTVHDGGIYANCSPCTKQSRQTSAVKYCQDCQEYFCSGCIEMHGYFSALLGHTMVDMTDHTSEPGQHSEHAAAKVTMPTERCGKHPEKLIDMYCKNHDLVACSICFLPHYKLCNDIHYVPEIASHFVNEASITKAKDNAKNAVGNLNDVMVSCKAVLTELSNAKVASLKAIGDFRKHINHVVDELEKKTVEQLENKHAELSQNIQHEVSKAGALKCEVEQRSQQLQVIDSNTSKMFVCQTLGKQVSNDAENLAKYISKSTSKVRLFYKNDFSISTDLTGLTGLGTVRDQKRHYGNLKSKMMYDIECEDDKEQCNIWGSCTTGNGDILLADNTNNRLKLLDKATYKMIATCHLPASPMSLYRINNTEVAVSLSNKCVYFISTADGLKITSNKQLDHNCFGLALTDDEMYISDGSHKVYVYSLEGKLLKTIVQDPNGDAIFSESRDITVSDDGNKIHVADSRKGLVTLSKEGKVLWRYTGSEQKGAYGVCTDGEGNVLVTGILSHNVLQFGTNGEKLGEIITTTDDVQSPVSVCFDKYNERLLVTKNGNFVFAFDFQ